MICENDIDVDSIVQIVTHAVMISNNRSLDDFIRQYENEIRRREISEDEKERLIRRVKEVWGTASPRVPVK